MAVTLREIIKQVQHLEMKLVAGETGLDHEVSWTHMDRQQTRFLHFCRDRSLLLQLD